MSKLEPGTVNEFGRVVVTFKSRDVLTCEACGQVLKCVRAGCTRERDVPDDLLCALCREEQLPREGRVF